MVRHLRPVEEAPEGSAYVIARSEHARPGMPFVLAECADRGVAVVFALAGQEVRSRTEMESDRLLGEALTAWESGDRTLFERERSARMAFRPAVPREERLRPVATHPSLLGRSAR